MIEQNKLEFEIEGVKCSFSTGLLARKSQTAVLAQMGNTVVLATANIGDAKSDADFFPLSVEYLESMYASGKISGSRFRKRDGFPSDDAVLNRRVIDRTFRPRFPDDYRNEVQIIVKVLSYDEKFCPVILSGNAVSLALMLSKAPCIEPMSLVRVGVSEAQNPVALNTALDRDDSMDGKIALNMVLGGDGDTITNIDASVSEFPEELLVKSMEYGLELMQPWLEAQKKFVAKYGKDVVKAEYLSFASPESLIDDIKKTFDEDFSTMLEEFSNSKNDELLEKVLAHFDSSEYPKKAISDAYYDVLKKKVRALSLEKNTRIGNRGLDEIRPRDYRLDLLPEVHGSALFTRGMTQVLSIVTLSSARSKQLVDDMSGESERRFFLHYQDSPFVYSETIGRVKYMPGGRQVGHSALAEKAFYPVLPSMEEFPYTVMCTCEVLEEHGSSSMASSTSPTMALMAAGVPIKKHVAGIAIGVMFNDDYSEYKILTDMGENEDFYGFMDFKVAGTIDGVTSVQMDTKTPGLKMEIFVEAFEKAKAARLLMIEEMKEVIAEPRKDVAANAPKVDTVKIPVSKIGELIGPGGKNIKAIIEETGAELDVQDDGTVTIFAVDKSSMDAAREEVSIYAFVPVAGELYEGTVVGLAEFGCFVELVKGVSGLVHVSELKEGFVKNVEDEVSEGDKVKVKVLSIERDGKMKLSMKAAV
jgi:polyribonucleotide nucleotidyltransferase